MTMHPWLICLLAAVATPAAADTLIDNVRGLQVDKTGKLQHFTGVVIGPDGKVTRLLGTGDARPAKVNVRIDGRGRALLPGLIDAHGHVMGLGQAALSLDVTGTRSVGELQRRLKDYAAEHPADAWILGGGWNQELWADRKFPNAADLDAVVKDRPVVLRRVDGHALVANSAAMQAAGITAQTVAPIGGRIEQGLFVDQAMDLIGAKIPLPTPVQRDAWLAKAQQILRGQGLTATADMGTEPADWAAMRRAGNAGQLTVRIMSYGAGIDGAKRISPTGPTAWLYGDRLRMEGVKLYADGALGSRGAWLKAPYSDMPGTSGLRFHTDAQYDALVAEATRRHWQIATHAIGDAANAQVIRSYAAHGSANGDKRWRIEHVQIVDPADLPGIAANGIMQSFNTVWNYFRRMDRNLPESPAAGLECPDTHSAGAGAVADRLGHRRQRRGRSGLLADERLLCRAAVVADPLHGRPERVAVGRRAGGAAVLPGGCVLGGDGLDRDPAV